MACDDAMPLRRARAIEREIAIETRNDRSNCNYNTRTQ